MPELIESPKKVKWTVAKSENRTLGEYQLIRCGREIVARLPMGDDAHAEMVRMRADWLNAQTAPKQRTRRRK